MAYLSDEEEAKRCRYHKEGRTDTEIASLCGVTSGSIREWRSNRNLKPNKRTANFKRSYANYYGNSNVDFNRFYET